MNSRQGPLPLLVVVAALCAVGCSKKDSPTAPSVLAGPTVDALLLGNWTGTMTLTAGCVTNLPKNYGWTGVIRQGGATGTEIVFSAPVLLVFSEVYPLTLVGSSITFNVRFDSTYAFSGTIADDRRSISGTLIGGNCALSPTVVLPAGSWNGAHQ